MGLMSIGASGRLTVTAVDVGITDVVPGTGATKLGKAEDAASASGDTLVAVATVRRDAMASGAGTDGDYATLNTDANGRAWITGTVLEDVAAVTGDQLHAIAAVRRDAAASSSGTDGDYSTVNTDSLGRVWVHTNKDIFNIKLNPTVDTAVYAALDIIGGILTFANAAAGSGGSGEVVTLSVFDVSNQKPQFELLLFDATPAGGTYTDNGAAAWHATDAARFVGSIRVATADYISGGAAGQASIKNINLGYTCVATSLFGIIIAVATPDFVAATDLNLVLGVRRS